MAGPLQERIRATSGFLWLDATAYGGVLLAGGRVPWLEVDACAAWMRKVQGLLASDVVALPVGDVAAAWRGSRPELAGAMSAKRRPGVPLRTLLADEALREHLVALAGAIRASLPGPLFALALPSPRRWIALAWDAAFPGAPVEIDHDVVDAAAVHVADFLRSFATSSVDVLLLEDDAASAPRSAEDVADVQAVANVAAHYRWDLGIRLPEGTPPPAGAAGIDFWVASTPAAGAPLGLLVPSAAWSAEAPPAPPPGGFLFLPIPVGVRPETVLERLAAFRGR